MDINRFYKLFINQEFRFSTDSRNIDEGCIFFALKGAHFNGNEYAAQAIEAGAAFAVIDEGEAADEKIIKVENVLQYFQKLAQFHRNCFDLPLIGIAGSNGKTTCKNLIYSVLQKKFSCHCTSGNFNNHIGVPITLLKMPVNTEIAIIELGTNSPGEIEELCAIAAPNFGLITNIGKEHLEGFGTLEAVAREESEIYLHLMKNGGTAFINENDDCLLRMSRNLDQKLYYSQNQVEIQSLVPEIKFSYENVEFSSVLMGDYNLDNIMSALAIGLHFGVDLLLIAEAISEFRPDNNRSQVIQSGTNLIWLDAYNANPSSMEKAIENFAKLDFDQKVLILGDMFEMGEQAAKEHDLLLQKIAVNQFSDVLLLGSNFEQVAANVGLKAYKSMGELREFIKSVGYTDTAFLIKGSRGMKMEDVVEALVK